MTTTSKKEKMMGYPSALAVTLMFVFCISCKNENKTALQQDTTQPALKGVVALVSRESMAGFVPVIETEKDNAWLGGVKDVVFTSANGGLGWQDISAGLPEDLQREGVIAYDNGLYLRAGNDLYFHTLKPSVPFWKKEIFPANHAGIVTGKRGIVAYNNDGQFLQRLKGASAWTPVYTNFHETGVRTLFESDGGAIFVGSENGLFKSTNGGETWKQVYKGGWGMKLAERNGVLMAASQKGIIRSTDGGETWDVVVSEGGVGISVEVINGGFAAITYNTTSQTRRIRASYDGGITWQPIDAGLPESPSIASIVQVGAYLFCGHPAGVFRSSDQGKTWKLLLPAVGNKVFNLSVSGDVIYAIARDGGC